jgi:2-dehydropantoate 2-reductase
VVVAVARATGGNRTSMLQDVQSGRPTEIDALCGAVCRDGARLGVPTPVNARLLDDVRALETGTSARESR